MPVFTILSLGFLHGKGETPVKELTNLMGEEKPGPDGARAISEATLTLNETAYVTCEQWGSVGIDCEYEISDDQIFSFMRSEVKYRFPERMKLDGTWILLEGASLRPEVPGQLSSTRINFI